MLAIIRTLSVHSGISSIATFFYLVFPKLSSRAHFILRAPLPPLVERAPPPAPVPPCLPGEAMVRSWTLKTPKESHVNKYGALALTQRMAIGWNRKDTRCNGFNGL